MPTTCKKSAILLYCLKILNMKFVFLYIVTAGLLSTAQSQSKQVLIKDIRLEFQKINSDKNLKINTLEAEEFLENNPDGGAELKGYKRKDSIVKIVEWIGLSYGNRMREFYFKNQKLIFVYEKFDSFIDEKSESLNHSKPKKAFEGRYYFNNDKLIDEKLSGKKPMEDEKTNPTQLLNDAKEYVKILSEKK